jgi:hypothetical protein
MTTDAGGTVGTVSKTSQTAESAFEFENLAEPSMPAQKELSKHDRGWRRVVRNFTPSYVLFLSSFHRYAY